MYFGRSTQDLGDVSNPRLTVSLFITLSQTMLHNLPRSGCYDDFQRTIFGKHVRIQRFSDARKKVPSWHKRPGQLLCTYIRILWLKRCFRYEAGHPSTVTSETVTPSVDMALDGERDPVRRPAARVRASVSVSRTSPLNKGKTSPSKSFLRKAGA